MLFQLLLQNPLAFVLLMAGLVISIGIHEFAHCLVTDRLGDPTPRIKGRLTLNPFKHLDPLGTLAIIFAGFGWGKAAPYDPYNLKEPVRDVALIAAAGPLSNLILAGLISVLLQLGFGGGLFALFAVPLIVINIALAVFNLLPIYPLDGGKIMRALLPHQASLEYEEVMEKYGIFILIALIMPWAGGQSAVSALLRPIMDVVLRVFI